MRQIRPFVFAVLLALPAVAGAKKPEPVACPADVALALAEACPCDGVANGNGPVVAWKNHGKYVSCTVRYRNALRKAGCLTQDDKRTIARCSQAESMQHPLVRLAAVAMTRASDGKPLDIETLTQYLATRAELDYLRIDPLKESDILILNAVTGG